MLAPGAPASSPGWCDSSQAVTAGRSRPGGTSDMCAMMSRMPRTRVLTPLRWSDMDAYGHVNNVQFLRLLEDARVVDARAETTVVLFDGVNDRPRRMTPAEGERVEAGRDEPVRWRSKRAR